MRKQCAKKSRGNGLESIFRRLCQFSSCSLNCDFMLSVRRRQRSICCKQVSFAHNITRAQKAVLTNLLYPSNSRRVSFSASVSRAETTCFFFAAIYLCFQLTCEKRFLVNDLSVGKVWCLFVDVNYSPKMRAQIYQAFWPITIIEPETKAKERDSWTYRWNLFKTKKNLLFFFSHWLENWLGILKRWSDDTRREKLPFFISTSESETLWKVV